MGRQPMEGSCLDAPAEAGVVDPLRHAPAPDPRGRRKAFLRDSLLGRHHGENGHPGLTRA